MSAAALEYVRGRARLHIDRHLIDKIGGIRDIEHIDIGMPRVELRQQLLRHGGKPTRVEILIHELDGTLRCWSEMKRVTGRHLRGSQSDPHKLEKVPP